MRDGKEKKGRFKRGRSIDGIVSGGPRLDQPAGHDDWSNRQPGLSAPAFHPNRMQPSASIGSELHRAEGFHPMRPGSGALGAAAASAESGVILDEPIVLDEEMLSAGGKKIKTTKGLFRRQLTIKRIILTLLAIFIAGGAYLGIKFYVIEHHLFRGGGSAPALASTIDINKLRSEGDGRVNVLILGIGGPGHDGPDLTDTMMIASIDPVNKQVALLSIPRDLWVRVPGDGSEKINAVYANAKEASKSKTLVGQEQDGINALDKTLSPIIGIPIHYHAIIDFTAFQEAVDAVGGVKFYVPDTLYDPTIAWENHWNPTIAPKGIQQFDGHRALLYARSRETSTDFARSERQRQLLVALKDKILSVGTFSNPIRISQLMDSLGNNIYTDFSLNDIKQLYSIVSGIPSSSISSLDMVTPPHDFLTTANLNGLSIVRPKAGLYDFSAIQNYVRNALRDGFLLKENAPIAVYNATSTQGLAAKEGDLLKSYGYNVVAVETAPKITEPATTTLVDLTNGQAKYTRHYLQQRLSTVAINNLPGGNNITPPAGTQFVIILGKDAATSTVSTQ